MVAEAMGRRNKMTKKEELFRKMSEIVVEGDDKTAAELARKALDLGIDAYEAIIDGFTQGMEVVSKKYEEKEMFVPELLLSARALNTAVEILRQHIKAKEKITVPRKVVVCSVQGDIHDIGKNIVVLMLRTAGYEVYDLGRDVPLEVIINKAEEVGADIIAISGLMTTSMMNMAKFIKLLKERGIRKKYKVMIGGAPINEAYCEKIGADGTAPDAAKAVRKADQLMKKA